MKINISKNYNELSKATANYIIDYVNRKPASLICLPSGQSPTGTLDYLVQSAEKGIVDFSNCSFVALDEWVGIDGTMEGSSRQYLNKHFFDHLNIDSDKIIFFDGLAADLESECKRVDNEISKHGSIDIMLVGIGMNGHIGLNEPGTSFDLYSHVVELDELTVTVAQKYFQQQTALKKGITLGLKHLMESKIPVLIASGMNKAEIIKKALGGPVSNSIPATILQTHPDCQVFLDKDAASLLEIKVQN